MKLIARINRILGVKTTQVSNDIISQTQELEDDVMLLQNKQRECEMLKKAAIYNYIYECRLMKEEQHNKRREKEAKARRYEAEKWERAARNNGYRTRSAQESCIRTTHKIADELFDGIFLNLNEHNKNKSPNVQKRILRRIVEKRQAQAAHRNARKSDYKSRFTAHMYRRNTGYCMYDLYRLQHAC